MQNSNSTLTFVMNYVYRAIDTGMNNIREKKAIQALKERNTFFERNCKYNLLSYLSAIDDYNEYYNPSYYERIINKEDEWRRIPRINNFSKPKLINYY